MAMEARAEIHFIIDQAIQNMKAIQAEAIATGQTVGGAFTGTDADVAAFNQALNTLGRSFVVTGGAITGAVGLAVNSFMSFEQQMDAVAAVSEATAEEMEALTAAALRIGQETSFNANQVGAAMEILAKAGIDLADITNGVAEGAVRLSEATGVDITLSAETAAAAMTVFNHTADETEYVMNVIAQSANASMLDVQDWTSALMYAGPIVSTLGYGIEDLAHMMVILGDAGMRGSVASTSIRNILMQISDTSSKATEGIRGYNIAMENADGTSRSLMEIMTDLVPHWNELNDAARVDLANQWFGARGGPAFLNMMNAHTEAVNRGGDAFEEAGKKMATTGDIYTMSEKRMDNLAGSIERLRGSVETLMISFGSRLAPAIRVVVDILDKIVDSIANSHPVFQTIVMVLAALTGGALLLGGTLMLMLPQILAVQAAFVKLSGMGGVLSLLLGPIRAIGVAFMTSLGPISLIIAAVAALYLAWRHNFLGIRDLTDKFISRVKEAWEAVSGLIDGVSWLFGKDHKSKAELDIKSTTDEGYDSWRGMGEDVSKNANLAIKTQPDDMFIEYVYDADGTVIGYEAHITSSTDGTEQTGRILSSSRDPNDPDLIHMEIELASGETVEGTYNEITGKFSAIDGNVNIGATFVGDAHYIKEETLPDGSKAWKIYEKDGDGAFGAILESYEGEQGEAYILIEGEDGGFWATVDIATGDISDPHVIPIDGDTGRIDGKLESIRSATGNTVTVLVDGDGQPFYTVLDEIIHLPSGNKLVRIELANGDEFLLTVDGVTGQIIDQHEIKITADTAEAESRLSVIQGLMRWFSSWAEPKGGLVGFLGRVAGAAATAIDVIENLQAIFRGDWPNVDWRFLLDVAGLEFVVGIIDGAIEAYQTLHRAVDRLTSGTPAGKQAPTKENTTDPVNYAYPIEYKDGYAREHGLGSAYADPYRPTENLKPATMTEKHGIVAVDITEYTRSLGEAAARNIAFTKTLEALNPELAELHPNIMASASAIPMFGSNARRTDDDVRGATSGIAASGGILMSSFMDMARSVISNSDSARASGVTNFDLLGQTIASSSLAAQTGALANFGTLQSTASTQFGSMNTDTTSKMTALQAVVASRASQASTAGSTQFNQLGSNVGSRLSEMQSAAQSRMSTLQGAVTSQSSTARQNAVSQFSQMNSTVALRMAAMELNTGLKLRAMASGAKTQSENMASNLDKGASTGASNVNSQLAKIALYIAGQGVKASAVALLAGQNIGNSFARGMELALDRIRSAASSMVAAANAAVMAKAMIASPSKLFMRLGEYMGEGVEVGLLKKVAAVERASEALVYTPNLQDRLSLSSGYHSGRGSDLAASGSTTIHNWITIPPDAWERFNKEVASSAKFVRSWQSPEAIAQYLGDK